MKKFIFPIIILIAVFLRFWKLGDVPPSPDWDEAALGYNAYSILKTGRDEYGIRFPAVLRSFDDYKPPLYMYLTVPSVALFGLNTWAVRLPSAIAGILAVIGSYLLAAELLLLLDEKNRKRWQGLPVIVSGLLAISPWNVHFSRIAFEANIGVTLNIWWILAFLKALKYKKLFVLSAILAVASLYAYHSERVFTPLLLVILAIIFRNRIFENGIKPLVPAIAVGIILLLPLLKVFADPVNWTRLKGTSALSDQTRLLQRSTAKLISDAEAGISSGKIYDNRRIVFVQKLAEGYLSHFSLRWLFLTGDNDRHHAPDMGLLYLAELPFIFWGMYKVARIGGLFAGFIFGWFFIAPIAASPTNETPHAIRSMVFLPLWQLFAAAGLLEFLKRIRQKNYFIKNIFFMMLIGAFGFNIAYYLHMYYGHMNREFSYNWQYGYKQAVEYAVADGKNYRHVVVSTKLEQPHIFFLFYLTYDPVLYLNEGGTASGGFAETRNKFGRYNFREIVWDQETHDGNTLFIGTPKEIPDNNTVRKINYLDGSEAIRIGK